MSKEAKILGGILIVVVGAMVALFALANQGGDTPAPVGDKSKIIRDNTHKKGSGPVQIVEFADFQCPACGAIQPSIKELLANQGDNITYYFRHFPLTELHRNAMVAAQATEAAGDQGKFWEMHDKLYDAQQEWSELNNPDAIDKFTSYAKDLSLDTDKFRKALTEEQFKTIVEQDAADAGALNLNATPTFFINGTQYNGKTDYASLRDAVEAELKK